MITLFALLPLAFALDLEVGEVVRGEPVVFHVSGATPGQEVGVAVGRPGVGPCPSWIGGCLDVQTPTWLGPATADHEGRATLKVRVPRRHPLMVVGLQAVGAPPGADTSPVVRRWVLDDLLPGPPLTITSVGAFRRLQHARTIHRDVVVRGLPHASLVLPHLVTAHAALTFDDNAASEVVLPRLVEAPAQWCGHGTLAFSRNAGLERVHLPSLVTGSLCSEGNGPVRYELPALESAFAVSLTSPGRQASPPTDAAEFLAPVLADVVDLKVYYSRLTSLSLPALRTVGTPVQVWHNAWLTGLHLPELQPPAVLVVVDNVLLSTCEVEDAATDAGLGPHDVVCRDNLWDEACSAWCEP